MAVGEPPSDPWSISPRPARLAKPERRTIEIQTDLSRTRIPLDISANRLTNEIESATQYGSESGNAEGRRRRRRRTSHLKDVPQDREMRDRLRVRCDATADALDHSTPLGKDEMEVIARQILEEEGLPEAYLGWMMVMLATSFWRDQVASVPYDRRLFLLPHCLKHAEGCPADYNEFGLDCRTCGACSIADFRTRAEDLGYRVLVAEGSPVVLKIIVSGYIDAIVGVACLNVLEKAIDKILLAGVPCMAVPLLSSDCRNTKVDEDWVRQMVETPYQPTEKRTKSYLHLMRGATHLFQPDRLETVVPRTRGSHRLGVPTQAAESNGNGLIDLHGNPLSGMDPLQATEAIAYDFLSKGGKHSRPFITMAVYDAMTGGKATGKDGAQVVDDLSDAIKQTAMSIEVFHKASLVHDDIEDSDDYRYGEPAMHKKFGTATAINVGDYLVGMGYRLVSRNRKELGGDVVADILDCLAEAHQRLSEGQGAELVWRDSEDKSLSPIDALKVYALKTSPAFEVAFYSGLRLACDAEPYRETIRQFARHMGVAFQILNDLKDWQENSENKGMAGGDVLEGRPTLLFAFALEALNDDQKAELIQLISGGQQNATDKQRLQRVRELYTEAGVFEKANRMVEKYEIRAEEIADGIQPDALRDVMFYLIETVLQRPADDVTPTIEFNNPTFSQALPIIGMQQ